MTAYRDFTQFNGHSYEGDAGDHDDVAGLFPFIAEQVIGSRDTVHSPFGDRRITYCDYTASGRALQCFEDYIQHEVMPLYANTHTSSDATGLQTTLFRTEARAIVSRSLGCSKDDEVLFVGNGATGAMDTLIRILRHRLSGASRVTVYACPFAHHSSLLPWRELDGVDVVNVREDAAGVTGVDLHHLRELLNANDEAALRIGCFSAASNVTGIHVDVEAVSRLLHSYGALSIWDYASAGPYVPINMSPADPAAALDAIVLSPHKMPGGVGAPGVLALKKSLLAQSVAAGGAPSVPGGGTVFYVTESDHRYLDNFHEREEGGTPNIVGAIRAGLCFRLKEAIGPTSIAQREEQLVQRVQQRFAGIPSLEMLGHPNAKRLAIFSFMIRHGDLYLHFNFVCALLNDLFGIQARGGCACAGPYAQRLLGMSQTLAKEYERLTLDRHELFRPGFVRLNLAYFLPDDEINYILNAVAFVAEHGHLFLPLYGYHKDTGEWRHRHQMTKLPHRRWLGSIQFKNGMTFASKRTTIDGDVLAKLHKYLKEAETLRDELMQTDAMHAFDVVREEFEACAGYRWFMLPFEAQLRHRSSVSSPFFVDRYTSPSPSAPVPEHKAPVETRWSAKEMVSQCQHCFHRHTNDASKRGHDVDRCMTCDCVDFVPFEEKMQRKQLAALRRKLCKKVGSAIQDFDMIQEGDRVLVAVSGGKDSMTLVDVLLELQRKSPVSFTVGACTIDPQHPEYDPSRLKEYFATLGVPFFYEEYPIMALADDKMNPKAVSICSFCARLKRGKLYGVMRREGYNVLAMGQHTDDLSESFLMSAFYNGTLRTMKANYHADDGDVRIIRPLVYVRERQTREYAARAELPVINENCPACYEAPQERARMKQLLAAQEHIHPDVHQSLLRAMRPLIARENARFKGEDATTPPTEQILR